MGLPDWILPFKEPKTEIKHLNNRYYKYEVSYYYSPELKRTVKKTGRLLGKITREDGFVPSEKNKLRQEAENIPKADIKIYGVCALFEKLLEDEIPSLISVFGKERAEQLLTFAMMRWAYQSPVKRVADYQAHDFCSEKWGAKTPLNDKKITELLKHAGENRQTVLEWQKKLLPQAGGGGFVMMDSTHIMSRSENLNVNMPGYNSSFDYGKQVRLMYMFSSEARRPVYYRLINGNITDITSMSLCVKETGIKDAVFIADKGFYCAANIKALEERGLKYLIPLRRNNPAVDYSSLETNDFKKNLKRFAYQKRMIWYYKYGGGGKNYITFLDDRLRVEEETDYLQRIETVPDSYSEEGYFEKLRGFGTLTIAYSNGVCNAGGAADDARAIYEAYKQRNEIEILFDSYKNFLKSDASYMQNRFVPEGWLFTNFIAMLAYYKIFYRLREADLLAKYSPKDIIELSKSVYQVKIRGEWHLSETTAKLRKLFEKLNIDYLF